MYSDPALVPAGVQVEYVEITKDPDTSVWGFFNYMVSGSADEDEKDTVASDVASTVPPSASTLSSSSSSSSNSVGPDPILVPLELPEVAVTHVNPSSIPQPPHGDEHPQFSNDTIIPSFASVFTNNESFIQTILVRSGADSSEEESLELLESPRPHDTIHASVMVELETSPPRSKSVEEPPDCLDTMQINVDSGRSEINEGSVDTLIIFDFVDPTVCPTCGHRRSCDYFSTGTGRRRVRSL